MEPTGPKCMCHQGEAPKKAMKPQACGTTGAQGAQGTKAPRHLRVWGKLAQGTTTFATDGEGWHEQEKATGPHYSCLMLPGNCIPVAPEGESCLLLSGNTHTQS